jgi:hypothetical protein
LDGIRGRIKIRIKSKMGDVGVAGIEEVFLAEVAKVGADFGGDIEVVVDDEADIVIAEDGEDFFGGGLDFVAGPIFSAELNEIRTAFAKLPRHLGRIATVEVGGVDEGVEGAVGQGLHRRSSSGGQLKEISLAEMQQREQKEPR